MKKFFFAVVFSILCGSAFAGVGGQQLSIPVPISKGGTGSTTAAGAAAALQTIGVGQTLHDMTASRVLGTTYTNNTGRVIWVSVSCGLTANGWITAQVSMTNRAIVSASSTITLAINFPVFPGESYVVTSSQPLGSWMEIY